METNSMEINCQFCKGNKFKIIKRLEKGYYYKCKKCGSIIQIPYPDKTVLNELYYNYKNIKTKNSDYLNIERFDIFKNEFEKSMKEIKFPGFDINDKCVDFGCANGMLLKYMSDKCYVIGVDKSKTLLSEAAKLTPTATLLNSESLTDILSLPFKIDKYFFMDVLEHTLSPELIIAQSKMSLKPDGYIIISTPVSGFISSIFGSKWRFLLENEHLNIPSIKGIKSILESYNYKIEGITRFGSGFTYGMCNSVIKKIFDFLAKFFKIGDRAVLLVKK